MRWSTPPPWASEMALSLATRSSTPISVFCRKILPSPLTEIVSGSLFWSRLLAWLWGRSSGTPTVRSGAETMKMMSRTSMTSTIGVTLISLMMPRRRWRRRPDSIAPPGIIPMRDSPSEISAALVDLPRQDCREFVREAFEALSLLVHLGRELVVENRRRYGSHEADCSCEQGLGNAGRHHGERGVLRGRNRLKARHDAPDGAEEADEGAGRADRRQNQ